VSRLRVFLGKAGVLRPFSGVPGFAVFFGVLLVLLGVLSPAFAVTGMASVQQEGRTLLVDRASEGSSEGSLGVHPLEGLRLEEILEDVPGMENLAGGMSVAVNVPGASLWTDALGFADESTGDLFRTDDVSYAASITKTFVSVMVLQLMEEGKIELDVVVSEYLEGVPYGDQITVRQLLQHTSGLVDYAEASLFSTPTFSLTPLYLAYLFPEMAGDPADVLEIAARSPLLFPPGSGWSYSNTNYVVLGLLVEAITGNALAEELAARITGPLGLDHTVIARTSDDPVVRVVPHYHEDDPDVYKRIRRAPTALLSVVGAAGALVSTSTDLVGFFDALVVGDLLLPETREEMFRGVPIFSDVLYGLGVMIKEEGEDVIFHTGGFPGYGSVAAYHKPSGVTVSVLLNDSKLFPYAPLTALLDAIQKAS